MLSGVSVRFTIAVPTHDRRETVVLAVRSALAQTRPPEQVIVLCDGCSDGTADALRALGDPCVEVIELAKAAGYGYEHRNRSLELARGEAILWLADDDLLLPDHLERLGALWDSGRFDLVQSHSVIVHPDDSLEWLGTDWSVPAHRAAIERANSNAMASVSIRVELARAIGGWDASLPRAADWNLWWRALTAGARSAAIPAATHLHFRATGREQAWPLRVRQNTEWFARLEDAEQLSDLRIALDRVRAEHDSRLLARIDALEEIARDAHAQLAELHATYADLHVAYVDLQGELTTVQASSAQLGEKLSRIESGGWWRLRRRLLPLLRLANRSR